MFEEGRSVCWVVVCDAGEVIRYDRRASELCNAALDMKQDTTNI